METSQHMLNILAVANSSHLYQLQNLQEEVYLAVREAKSNVEYLNMLKNACTALDICIDLSKLPKYLPKIIQLCRVIWINSPFLHSDKKMTRLFEVIGNQLISVCRKVISLNKMFAGKTRKTIKVLLQSICTCQKYKNLYMEVIFTIIILIYLKCSYL
jgi:hypothetical protein